MAAKKNYIMREWKSGAEMHEDAKQWISELEFITSEHHFFEDLLAKYFLRLSEEEHYGQGKQLVKELVGNREKNHELLDEVTQHNNHLIVLLDGKNEFDKEDRVKEEHRSLEEQMQEHYLRFRELKTHTFDLVGSIIKEIRRDHLLRP